MNEEGLIARVEEEESGAFVVRSPSVGFANALPDLGVYLNPLQTFLTLRIHGRRRGVELPRHVHGRVAELFVEGIHVPIEYDQPLFRLEVQQEMPEPGASVAAGSGTASDTGDELVPIPSPSDGIFYRRASPESPPYVEEGSRVTKGTVLGLVEVMKSFNQIVYGGPALPPEGTVAKVGAEDSSEVKFGAPLFWIRPEA